MAHLSGVEGLRSLTFWQARPSLPIWKAISVPKVSLPALVCHPANAWHRNHGKWPVSKDNSVGQKRAAVAVILRCCHCDILALLEICTTKRRGEGLTYWHVGGLDGSRRDKTSMVLVANAFVGFL
jgi:hypothetical protein